MNSNIRTLLIIGFLLFLLGFGILFFVDWRIGLGVFFVGWSMNLDRDARKKLESRKNSKAWEEIIKNTKPDSPEKEKEV